MRIKGMKFVLAAAFLCLSAAASVTAEGAVYRVSVQGSVKNDGSSWDKALHPVNFIEKLETAKEGDEFWVAAGTYAPDIWGGKDARKRSFLLKRGVALYGGFSGKETKRSQRDWKKNKTILSGELQGDKNPVNNSYNVVRVHETADQKTVIDGFFITGGYAIDKPEYPYGGGLLNQGKPVISNCVFEGNHAKSGGAVFAWSRPAISNCTFRNNYASEEGGALAIHLDSPSVTDCTFMDNRA
ncbi:MAG: right-handed parallel beta-helix repeat-containing protein, partial [Synergistaceae bacterium]|nr:right-handed parallel beta-helix repeat-containing protein [Synergistaceae bacterium]